MDIYNYVLETNEAAQGDIRMRSTVLLLIAMLCCSCIGGPAKQAIDQNIGRVQSIQQSILSVESQPQSTVRDSVLVTLKNQLSAAQTDLDRAQAEGARERIHSTAKIVESVTAASSPLLGILFPPALALLGIIGSLAGLIKNKFGKKEDI
jgi:hypothetical protein